MSFLSEKSFVNYCHKRGLKIDVPFLARCREGGVISPLLQEGDSFFYHPFQVVMVAEVLREVKIEMSLEEKKLKFMIDFPIFRYLPKYLRHTFLQDSSTVPLKPVEVKEVRDLLFIHGRQIDPMRGWYVFLRTIRLNDPQKFKSVEGVVLLAHDYYTLAETLTSFYQELCGEKLIAPEDLADGRAGSWKMSQCEKCHENMRISDFGERFCHACKSSIGKTSEGALKCKCGKVLIKYIDGAETLNNILPYSKDEKIPIYTYLSYGKVVFQAQCQCGEVVSREIEQGWF